MDDLIKSIVKAAFILGLSIVLSVLIYTFNTRYYIVRVDKSAVIKLNRITGTATYIEGIEEYEIREGELAD